MECVSKECLKWCLSMHGVCLVDCVCGMSALWIVYAMGGVCLCEVTALCIVVVNAMSVFGDCTVDCVFGECCVSV